jgi:glutaredoxin
MHRVVLYSRPGCHLCDEVRRVIVGVRERLPFEFREVDIDDHDDLVRDFGLRIPVVLVDDVERFEISVDAGALAALVRT